MLGVVNKTFKVSVSREGYPDKETAKKCLSFSSAKAIGKQKMAFKVEELTISEFLDFAINGHSFCNIFNFDSNKKYWVESGRHWTKCFPIYRRGLNKGYFKINFKCDKYFAGSQTIFVDIDYTKYQSLKEYISVLKYKPSCAYLSYSDGLLKGGLESRRFRLVYIFDSVLDRQQFYNISINLYNQITKDTGEQMMDLCGMSPCQYMNGSNKSEVYNSGIIYNSGDIKLVDVFEIKENKKKKVLFNKELVYDMEKMPYRKVVEKWYAKGLRYIYRTEKEFDGYYTTDTKDFYTLFWHKNTVLDGNKRRMKLFLRASIRRLMKQNITADELLYNLFIDRYRFFDNSDDVLDIETLKLKVKGALNTDIEVIKGFMKNYKQPSFIINSKELNKRKLIGKARTDIKNNQIAEVYDFQKSVSENLEQLKELGIKISRSRLYKWAKDFNVVLEKKVNIIYRPYETIRENAKRNGVTKYQIEKYIKECNLTALNSSIEVE